MFYDQNDCLVARYSYDAWGKVTKTVYPSVCSEFGEINPFLYRGYYFDWETGLYYLNSRYYDPELGRFLNADAVEFATIEQNVLGHNLFGYCFNDPINMKDSFGCMAEYALALEFVSAIGAAGASNSWNPIGWALIVIALLIVVGVAIFWGIKAIKRAKQNALVKATLLMNFASTAATPPPPNKGGKGTKVTSKTLYNKRGKNGYRIDVENPGNRAGQIHLQKNGAKYYYNIKAQEFRIGSSSGKLAPNSIQQLLKEPNVIKAIAKGLQILGY